MRSRLVGTVGVGLVCAVSCRGITYPTSPTINSSSSGPTPTNIVLTATPSALPTGGGTATLAIRVLGSGGVGVPGTLVKVSSTEGALDRAELTTNDSGEGHVQWTTTKTGTVIARAGTVDGNVTIGVAAALPPHAPPTLPPPAPPAPDPAPQPPAPPPNPTMPVTLTAAPASAVVGQNVTFTATATPTPDAGVIRHFEWDFGDGTTTTSGLSVLQHQYTTPGPYTARVIARTTTWQHGTGTANVTVTTAPAPPLSVSLAATPGSVPEGSAITFTASPADLQAGETVTVYQWDFDGNGTFEVTTGAGENVRSRTYATNGIYTAKVKITTSSSRTAEGTRQVIITTP